MDGHMDGRKDEWIDKWMGKLVPGKHFSSCVQCSQFFMCMINLWSF